MVSLHGLAWVYIEIHLCVYVNENINGDELHTLFFFILELFFLSGKIT